MVPPHRITLFESVQGGAVHEFDRRRARQPIRARVKEDAANLGISADGEVGAPSSGGKKRQCRTLPHAVDVVEGKGPDPAWRTWRVDVLSLLETAVPTRVIPGIICLSPVCPAVMANRDGAACAVIVLATEIEVRLDRVEERQYLVERP